MTRERRSQRIHLLKAFGLLSLVSTCLFLVGAKRNHNFQYWFLLWNLFLAWLPLIFAYALVRYLKKHSWLSWQALALSALWLGFLPNSFYMISDFIHISQVVSPRTDLLYDVIMFAAFAFTGATLGFTSLFFVHSELLKRIRARDTSILIAIIFLLCGFAIYLGRYLRLNTWDFFVNPAGILFDVSDRVINLRAHPQTVSTTVGFFVLLGTIYIAVRQLALAIQHKD